MVKRKPPFRSRTDALRSIAHLYLLAQHGLAHLEDKYRSVAPGQRKRMRETRRGLNAIVREFYAKGRR
jgi:hypothetical protein